MDRPLRRPDGIVTSSQIQSNNRERTAWLQIAPVSTLFPRGTSPQRAFSACLCLTRPSLGSGPISMASIFSYSDRKKPLCYSHSSSNSLLKLTGTLSRGAGIFNPISGNLSANLWTGTTMRLPPAAGPSWVPCCCIRTSTTCSCLCSGHTACRCIQSFRLQVNGTPSDRCYRFR
jgi:hypothetical protein